MKPDKSIETVEVAFALVNRLISQLFKFTLSAPALYSSMNLAAELLLGSANSEKKIEVIGSVLTVHRS